MMIAAIAIVLTLAWTPPTTNEDGTPLTDLAGHRAYWGNVSGLYTGVLDVGMATTAVLTIHEGRSYFAVTAYDLAGNESEFSQEITWPDAPTDLRIGLDASGRPRLTWDDPSPASASGYVIRRSADGGQTWQHAATVAPDRFEWTENWVSFLYAVEAIRGPRPEPHNGEMPPTPGAAMLTHQGGTE